MFYALHSLLQDHSTEIDDIQLPIFDDLLISCSEALRDIRTSKACFLKSRKVTRTTRPFFTFLSIGLATGALNSPAAAGFVNGLDADDFEAYGGNVKLELPLN